MPARRRINRSKTTEEVMLKMELDSRRPNSEVTLQTKKEAEAVAAWWRDVEWPNSVGVPPAKMPDHGYETGSYRESIHVEQLRDARGRFTGGRRGLSGRRMPAFQVITRHPNAIFIEYGTGIDHPNTHSSWGRFTPTPEFAPAFKTAMHFRGTAP